MTSQPLVPVTAAAQPPAIVTGGSRRDAPPLPTPSPFGAELQRHVLLGMVRDALEVSLGLSLLPGAVLASKPLAGGGTWRLGWRPLAVAGLAAIGAGLALGGYWTTAAVIGTAVVWLLAGLIRRR